MRCRFAVAELTAEDGVYFFVGEALVHCHPVGAKRRPEWAPFRHLDALAREAGVQPLSEFISEDSETAGWRFFGDVPVEPPPPSRWFTAAEGLATVGARLDYLTTHTERVADVRQVIAGLRQIEKILRHLDKKGVLWHLEDRSWW
jgi:hypothetical protein